MKPDRYIVKAYFLLMIFLISIFLYMWNSNDAKVNFEGKKFELYEPSA